MITAIYASVCALIIVWLSLNVVKGRRRNRVIIGDGGNEDLQFAIGAQANATQYIPIALILLFLLEQNNANAWFVHGFGLAFVSGRLLHIPGLLKRKFRLRVLGMQLTIYSIIGMTIVNLLLSLRSHFPN